MSVETADPSATRLAAMALDQMLDALIVADPDGVIRVWNRGAEVTFGYPASEAIGSPLEMIVPQRLKAAHAAGFREAVRAGHLKSHGEVLTTRANHKYGCRLYVDFSFGLLKDERGELLGVFALGRDVTARHMAQISREVECGAS